MDKRLPLLAERTGNVAFLILNRPDRENYIDASMLDEFNFRLDELKRDDELKVLCIESAGGDYFCRGSDPREIRRFDAYNQGHFELLIETFGTISSMPIPTVCFLRGKVSGHGIGFCLACDTVFASERSLIDFSGIEENNFPFLLAPQLSSRIGARNALGLYLGAAAITASDAQRAGLVSKIWPDSEMQAARLALAEIWNACDRETLGRMKSALSSPQGLPELMRFYLDALSIPRE